jgi:septum formation protein
VNPVVLASTSAVRRALLAAAGVSFEVEAPGVDEAAAKARFARRGTTPAQVANVLAQTKAVTVSQRRPELVIGADQTLDLDGRVVDKVGGVDEARKRLKTLRGRTHKLHSGVVVAKDGAPIWRETATASLTMRAFSDDYLEDYLARNGAAVLSSVGCYQLEGEGAQLFDHIDGDYFAILGLPLLGLLGCLRSHGAIAA